MYLELVPENNLDKLAVVFGFLCVERLLLCSQIDMTSSCVVSKGLKLLLHFAVECFSTIEKD